MPLDVRDPAAVGITGSELSPGAAERLRLDYQQTTDLVRSITDVRFKLLALVPTLSGAAVVVLGHPSSAAELLSVGLLGLTATVGVLLHELRNTQLYDYGLRRAQAIERELGLFSLDGDGVGGPFSDRPARTLRLLGLIPVDREASLMLVYSAAVAGWTYLSAWGAVRALGLGHARPVGGVAAVAVALLLLAELTRLRETS